MLDKKLTLKDLKSKVENFVNERDWEQFHNPKNLAMSISIEAAELMEIFQWSSNDESSQIMDTKDSRIYAIEEIADILIYTIAFCNRNNIDISEAILSKLKKNKKKYPKDKFKGKY